MSMLGTNTLIGKALDSLGATYIDNGFYEITEAKAKEINKKKLPRPGYEACVKVLGVWFWLSRTQNNLVCVWAVRDAKGWHVDPKTKNATLSEAGVIAAKKIYLQLLPEDTDGKRLLRQPVGAFMPPADRPYIVCILDWWDRSPCTWFCDLNKLDRNEPNQAAYFELILKGINAARVCELPTKVPYKTYIGGTCAQTDLDGTPGEHARSWGGRPDTVKHAEVFPPCQVEHVVTLYYDR